MFTGMFYRPGMHIKLKNRICWPHKLWSKLASWAQCSWGQLPRVLLLLGSVTSEGPLCHMVLCLSWAQFPCSLPPRKPALVDACQCLTTPPCNPAQPFTPFPSAKILESTIYLLLPQGWRDRQGFCAPPGLHKEPLVLLGSIVILCLEISLPVR